MDNRNTTPALTTLRSLKPGLDRCRRCDLWRNATQGVGGEGPAPALVMLVGEQPGDKEDLAGAPFVGPAGRILDQALAAADLPRQRLYVTNAVKHFKNEPRGKFRLHKKPDAGEVEACRWWLRQELRLVRPKLIVALGATAALTLFGKAVTIKAVRGRWQQLPEGEVLVTIHPSFLLRQRDSTARRHEFDKFVADLALVRDRALELDRSFAA
ncbi:MAG TPA: UdgX family uracil-DNA binding protein [Aestuariivirgaceae bacterium]|jgi:uracil-DNA glycosylase|nr:UdgX family uracil-DNA binding protein [Aestuariivirgaceae bacterium]